MRKGRVSTDLKEVKEGTVWKFCRRVQCLAKKTALEEAIKWEQAWAE